MTRGLAALAFVLAAGGALRWLWAFWTPRCNESCAGSVVVAMYATMAAIIGVILGISAMTVSKRWSLRRALGVYAAAFAAFGLWVVLLTRWAVA